MTIKFDEKNRAAAIKHIVAAIQSTDSEERWTPDPDSDFIPGATYAGFCGWLEHSPMCPVNRLAFVERWGEEVTADLEAEAKRVIEAEAARYAASPTKRNIDAANANDGKSAADLVVGDFVNVVDCGLKFDTQNIMDIMRDFIYAENDREHTKARPDGLIHKLCRITRIEDNAPGFFNDPACLANWKPQGDEGGCATDEDDATAEAKRAERDFSIFYTLAVLIREPNGTCVLLDPEGYEYARYCLFRPDYRTMFAPIYAAAKIELEQRRLAAEEEERRKAEAEKAAHDALIGRYSFLPFHNPTTNGQESKNLKAALQHDFPGVRFSVRTDTYSMGSSANIAYEDGPAEEEVKRVADYFEHGAFYRHYGSFSYVSVHRTISPAVDSRIRELAKEKMPETNGWDDITRGREVRRIERTTTFPCGKFTIKGFALDDKSNNFTLDIEQEKQPEPSPVAGVDGVSVSENREKNGIEIRFAARPSDDVLTSLKAHGWRWSRFAKCWYHRASDESRTFANNLVTKAA